MKLVADVLRAEDAGIVRSREQKNISVVSPFDPFFPSSPAVAYLTSPGKV